MEYTITSKENKLIKHIKDLHLRKCRDSQNQFFVEGIKMCREAISCGGDVAIIVVCPDMLLRVNGGKEFLADLKKSAKSIESVPENIFRLISDTETPQGVLAVVGKRSEVLKDYRFKPDALYILLDKLQDPGNVGTIIRTADAVGACAVLLSNGCADSYNPKVLRSSMGSIFRISVFEKVDLAEAIIVMQKQGISIVASSLKAEKYHFEIKYSEGIGLIIGSEAHGIDEELLKMADVSIKIPIPGGAESLNASVAAGVLMYEIIRSRIV